MKPEQQRIAIAEIYGWRGISPKFLVGYAPWRKETYSDRVNACPVGDLYCIPLDPLPEYLSDLNAMHEAEKVLDAGQWDDYQQQLREQVRGKGAHPRDISSSHATASQRAEAFLRTLGLWEE
jgi:hypothetical protein